MKKYELQNCGTVVSLDFTVDKDFGRIVVELVPDQINRIIDILYKNLPDKTAADKKCKEFLNTRLFPGTMKVEINIIPVLNKTVLKQCKEYKVSNPRCPAV